MKWGLYLSLAAFSMIKFMFAPIGGPNLGLNFFETYFSCVVGAIIAAVFFYFSSGYFMRQAHLKKVSKIKKALESGVEIKRKKVFTRTNKTIVRVKRKFGIWIMALYAPLFLSVPVGSIITAKFYRKEKLTFPIILIGIFVNGLITTGIAFLFFGPE